MINIINIKFKRYSNENFEIFNIYGNFKWYFFVIYRQSDEKGFHRWRTSFKAAVIIAASAAGLMSVNTDAIEPPRNNNQAYQERLLSDQEFNSFEAKDQKVILVKTGDSSSSVPTQTGRGQPNNFPTGSTNGRRTPHVNPHRTPPKVVDQNLGAGANPAGAGGGGEAAEFDDECPVPKKEESQEQKTFDYDYRSENKRKSDDQCSLDENTPNEINEKFDSKAVKKLIKTALENQKVKQEYEGIKKRINEGVKPIDIGKKSTNLPGNMVLIKGAHGRYVVEISGDQVNVLGIGARGNNKNMKTFQKLMNKMYDLNLQY